MSLAVFKGIILLCVVVFASGTSDVVELTNENFKETTKEGFWLVEYFAPWCGHCKKLAPTYEHLAKELKGKANIAQVDCTVQKDVCAEFGVKGYPTIKLLENGAEKEKYAGPRTATGFVAFLKEKAGLSEDVTITELPAAELKKPEAKKPAAEAEPEKPTDVTVLTDASFEEATKEGFWFIKFYAPWCGHCKKLVPAWDHLATQLKGKANIAKVDCTIHSTACSKHGVRGYPTLKLFKDGADFKAYSSGRDIESFAKFLKDNEVIASDVTVAPLPGAQPAAQKAPAAEEPEGPSDIINLGDADFAEKTKEGTWFVKFYAPWCGHCKRLAPTWGELATKVNLADSTVKIAKVDCTKFQGVCKDQGVRGYPTLKLFKNGSESDPFKGGRDLESLTSFVTQHGFEPKAPAAAAEAAPKVVHEDL